MPPMGPQRRGRVARSTGFDIPSLGPKANLVRNAAAGGANEHRFVSLERAECAALESARTDRLELTEAIKKKKDNADRMLVFNRLEETAGTVSHCNDLMLYLWAPNAEGRSCPGVRVPDTLLIKNGSLVHWFFTDKEGQIKRKSKEKLLDTAVIYHAMTKGVSSPLGTCALLITPPESVHTKYADSATWDVDPLRKEDLELFPVARARPIPRRAASKARAAIWGHGQARDRHMVSEFRHSGVQWGPRRLLSTDGPAARRDGRAAFV